MKIYTRRGDRGCTNFVRGGAVRKCDPHVELIGQLDTLNTQLGVVASRVHVFQNKRHEKLILKLIDFLQHVVYNCNGALAGAKVNMEVDQIVDFMEQLIDQFQPVCDNYFGPLRHFIAPGGNECSATMFHAASLARTCERAFWYDALSKAKAEDEYGENYPGDGLGPILNRFSDLLWIVSRWICAKTDVPEAKMDQDYDFDKQFRSMKFIE